MLVIRIETVGNRYQGRDWMTGSLWEITEHWSLLPAPEQDGGPKMGDEDVCGCSTLKQFHKWWKEEDLLKLPKKARIAILDIPKEAVTKCKTQVVFKRDSARLVGVMDTKRNISWLRTLRHSSETEKEKFSPSVKTRTPKVTRFKPITPS